MLQLEAHKINDTVSFIFSVRVPKLHILYALDDVENRNVNYIVQRESFGRNLGKTLEKNPA
jgi:hypothetical protein